MSELKPIAYAIYGIGGGKHYLKDVKLIPADDVTEEWRGDDDFLGDYWAGNEPLFLASTQPEATKPAQDLQLVVATSTETGFFHVVINVNDGKRSLVLYDKQHSLNGDTVGVADIPAAALASPADALVAGDRVDAERFRFLSTLVYPEKFYASGHPSWVIRYHLRGETFNSAIDAAIQAQKDGHG